MDQTKNVASQPIKNVVESIIDAGAFARWPPASRRPD